MKIAVRLDDITSDMDWKCFFRFKDLLDRYQIKPLIGIVPDNCDKNLMGKDETVDNVPEDGGRETNHTDFWKYVKDLEDDGWVIAMHGYRHVYSTDKGGIFPLNNFSEFAGKSYEEQLSMLQCGKKIFEEKGIAAEIFMAPAHSYDRNTLRALKETGFKAVTDGFGYAPYCYYGINFYPISFRLSSTFKRKSGYSTMVVHPGTVSEEELKKYERYFQNRNVQWINYADYLKQMPVQRKFWDRWKEYLMAKGKSILFRFK